MGYSQLSCIVYTRDIFVITFTDSTANILLTELEGSFREAAEMVYEIVNVNS